MILVFFSGFIAVLVLCLMLREKSFSKETSCYVVDPDHTFESEMAAQLVQVKSSYRNKKSRAFRNALQELYDEYHQLALQNGWLKPVIQVE
jgi:hypothetical protein